MVEVIGDVVIPSSLIIKKRAGAYVGKEGEIWLSGSKLWFNANGTAVQVITSA